MVSYTKRNCVEIIYIKSTKFDLLIYRLFIFSFQDDTALEQIVNGKSSINDKINYGSDKRSQVIKLLVEVLRRGLGNRVNQLCVLPSICKEWECTKDMPDNIGKLIIGLELNPETCFDIVDKGPEANLPEVSTYLGII